jgi:uncharacterized protein YjbI with pentapeptide repeats
MDAEMSDPNLPTRVIRKLTSWTHRFDDIGTKRDRAMQLVGVVLGTGAIFLLIDWLTDSGLFMNLLFPALETAPQVQAWSARVYAAVLILGLPVAFMLWHWRDRNVRDGIDEQRKQVENARKDINLKEFQEVQLRAAGALDATLPEEARQQLQIAALHQLRGFLRGEYGESFKRPAFELLLAGHAAAVHRVGIPMVQQQISDKLTSFDRYEIKTAVEAIRAMLSPVDRERIIIFRNEFQHIFLSKYRIESRRFDLLDLQDTVFPEGIALNYCHFFGTSFLSADLEGVNLQGAHFEGADLSQTSLKRANLFMAHLGGANLYMTHLKGATMDAVSLEYADLSEASFDCSYLIGVHLGGADLSEAHFEGADLRDARLSPTTVLTNASFNNATKFGELNSEHDWSALSEAEKETARAPWIARGAFNIDSRPIETV